MAWSSRNRLLELKIVAVLRCLFFLAFDESRAHDSFPLKQRSYRPSDNGAFAEDFGQYIACAGQGLLNRGDPLFRVDKCLSLTNRISHRTLAQKQNSQRLKSHFPGDSRSG